MVYKIDPDSQRNLPENKWLIKFGFVDATKEKLPFINRKTGERVGEDYEPISVEENRKLVDSYVIDMEPEEPFFDEDGVPMVNEDENAAPAEETN